MKTELRKAMEQRAGRARGAGHLPPVADWFGPADTDARAPRLELRAAGLHAPYGEEPRLVVRYSFAGRPGEVEESRVWADELDAGAAPWTAGHILSHGRELALEWLAARERWAALRMAALTARRVNGERGAA